MVKFKTVLAHDLQPGDVVRRVGTLSVRIENTPPGSVQLVFKDRMLPVAYDDDTVTAEVVVRDNA